MVGREGRFWTVCPTPCPASTSDAPWALDLLLWNTNSFLQPRLGPLQLLADGPAGLTQHLGVDQGFHQTCGEHMSNSTFHSDPTVTL